MQEALPLDGSKSECHYQLAQVYHRLGDTKKAEGYLERYRTLTALKHKNHAGEEFIDR